jgi:uracil-DNA glycosylase family 4
MERIRALTELEKEIISCERCPRLRSFCLRVARERTRQFREWEYWGRPLPGFGDPYAEILILGLAPAAHGGNRTGRMFTGDSSGDWLIRALYSVGLANQPHSTHRDDGLKLRHVYITASVRCAPPGNRPTAQEVANCRPFLVRELELLADVRVVVALGRLAFENYLKTMGERLRAFEFRHCCVYQVPRGRYLIASYHPSRQNTQTGRLKWDDWVKVFRLASKLAGLARGQD